jgi:hypothetical protein
MGRVIESVIIEIGEDAYKQNAVYRPWDELQMAAPKEPTDASASPLENLQPRLFSRQKSTQVNAPV